MFIPIADGFARVKATLNHLIKKRWIRFNRHWMLSKRQQFAGSTIILSTILLLTQVVHPDYRYPFVIFLSLCTYLLSAFCLREDLQGVEWVSLLMLPSLYSAAVGIFYFLLPVRWLTRIPIAVLYALGLYAILLTENIFNVAANRTIALLRAAHSIGFLLTFVTYFLLMQSILAFRLDPFINMMAVGLVSGLLVFQSLWCMELEPTVTKRVGNLTVALTAVMMEIAFAISFWPAPTMMAALFIAAVFYSLVGMAQQYVVDRMYKKTVVEFFLVALVVFIIFFVSTRWRGI